MGQEELPRTITALSGMLICVGVNIGAGVFVIPGLALGLVGSVGMVSKKAEFKKTLYFIQRLRKMWKTCPDPGKERGLGGS
jgi:hypothetical protein